MPRSLCVLLFVFFAASPAAAEIFKCVGKNGTDLYQNFPCQFESLGSTPMDAQSSKTPSAPSESNQVKPKPATAEVAAGSRSAGTQAEPRIGMTMQEVRASWGEPANAYYDELVDGRVEIWTYGGSRSVQFDLKGRVSALQR